MKKPVEGPGLGTKLTPDTIKGIVESLGGVPPPSDSFSQRAQQEAEAAGAVKPGPNEESEPQAYEEVPEEELGGSLPSTFIPGSVEGALHPILAGLNQELGIGKLHPIEVKLVNRLWTFRPMNFYDYEWQSKQWLSMRNEEGQVTSPTLAATNVAARLAAIDKVPIYEIYGVNTRGRHIPRPLFPPPDIRIAAAEKVLEWLREEAGMWELAIELDTRFDMEGEVDRMDHLPFAWGEIANQQRKLLVLAGSLAVSTEMQRTASAERTSPSGKDGEEQ